MVRIRLTRLGRRRRPFYRVVAIDSKKPRSGSGLSNLGYYDPIQDLVKLDVKGMEFYISKGAQMNDSVKHIYKRYVASLKD